MFFPGCAASQPCGRKWGIKMDIKASPLLCSNSESLQLVSVCASRQPHGPTPRPAGYVAMSPLQLTNKPCRCTHPSQTLLCTTPLDLTRDPHPVILWFTSTALMKLSQSLGCSWRVSAILQSKISSGESLWLKDKTGEAGLFLPVLWGSCVSLYPSFFSAGRSLSLPVALTGTFHAERRRRDV